MLQANHFRSGPSPARPQTPAATALCSRFNRAPGGYRRPQVRITITHAAADEQQKQPAQVTAAQADPLNLPYESDIQTYSGGSTSGSPNNTAPFGPSAVAPGTVVHGRYAINEVLGRGANAVTYAATDNTTGKKVGTSTWLCAIPRHCTHSRGHGTGGVSSSTATEQLRISKVQSTAAAG
eukprot:GHUV01020916.1.p2 GENE.GHUV01020916.1~~GHUV01020916.1.p2  ORF type:complete len:180 (+),score=50.48 GHUV01020916.1:168-707(+)